jgi:integrase
MIARLGLRSGDVAALTLADLDWRSGEITVHGKGNRIDRLPLPRDVGEAVAGYLRARMPGDGCRALFVSAYAPVRPLSLSGVGQVVKEASTRAGIPVCGPRLLRQALACDLLAAGAGLSEIAQVLRHWNIATTAIYAKADHQALAALVRPWPVPEQGARP